MKQVTGEVAGTSQYVSKRGIVFLVITVLVKVNYGHEFNQFQSCSDKQWYVFEDRIYRAELTLRAYTTARAVCQTYGGDLAVVSTKDIEEFVLDILPDFCYARIIPFWIGLNEMTTPGVFTWVDGTPYNSSLPTWGADQPSATHPCVYLGRSTSLTYDRFWYDSLCTANYRSVCSMAFVLPKMHLAPRGENIESNYIVISWQAWQGSEGIGPVRAYKINTKLVLDGAEWKNVGYVVNADATKDTFTFNLTNLEPNTDIEISIGAIDLCSGKEGERGPALSIRTADMSMDNALLMTQALGGSVTVPWVLFSIFGAAGNLIIWGLVTYTCIKIKSAEKLRKSKMREPDSMQPDPMPDSEIPTHSHDSAVPKPSNTYS